MFILRIYNKRCRSNLTVIHNNPTQHLPYKITSKLSVDPKTDDGAKSDYKTNFPGTHLSFKILSEIVNKKLIHKLCNM